MSVHLQRLQQGAFVDTFSGHPFVVQPLTVDVAYIVGLHAGLALQGGLVIKSGREKRAGGGGVSNGEEKQAGWVRFRGQW